MPPPPLKKPSEFKLIGTSPPRLDIPAKVAGAATFGNRCAPAGPALRCRAQRRPLAARRALHDQERHAAQGIEKVVIVPGGIAAIGMSWWQADKFLDDGIAINWQAGPEPKLDSAELWKRYAELLESGKVALERKLGTDPSPAKTQTVEAIYGAPYLAHAPMEPMNCTALFTKQGAGKQGVELWMPNQSPTLMRLIAAKTADVSQADVAVHTTFLGGGFGRRAEVDLVRQAVTCALALPDRPVKVLWSREEDIRHTTIGLWRWPLARRARCHRWRGQARKCGQAASRPIAGRPVPGAAGPSGAGTA
jgi:isoquinoline 1-oxidoreductase beta subunit